MMGALDLRRVVLASRNTHKLIELRRMLDGTGVELLGLDEVAPDAPELVEEGATFEENALSKAHQAAEIAGLPALADDSGLEVDALGGAPGVHSARFSGAHGNSAANTALVLEKLRGVPDEERAARFRCVVALVVPGADGEAASEWSFSGRCEGRIGHEPKGTGGFGYDPIVFLPDRGLTVAQLSDADKDAISHRGEAVRKLVEFLRQRRRTS